MRLLPSLAALAVGMAVLAICTGCGGSKTPASLSAAQVATALRSHGVSAHITWRRGHHEVFHVRGAHGPGVSGLLKLFSPSTPAPGVIATVNSTSPEVDAWVYDTAASASKFTAATLPGAPVRDSRTHEVIGRAFRVDNVVVLALHSAVPDALAAGRDLAAKPPS